MDEGLAEVKIAPHGKQVRVPQGTSLMAAARLAGLNMETPCGGRGHCFRCTVEADGRLNGLTPAEEAAKRKGALAEGERLACQARVYGDAEMRIPDTTLARIPQILEQGEERVAYPFDPNVKQVVLQLTPPSFEDQAGDRERLEGALARAGLRATCSLGVLAALGPKLRRLNFRVAAVVIGDEVVDLQPPETDKVLGVAFDIGTTTVVAYLLDLLTGRELAVASLLNPQTRYGPDVISRITFAAEQAEGLSILAQAIRGAMNELVASLCDRVQASPEQVYEISVAGNAAMLHLFLGMEARYLAMSPYVPVSTGSLSLQAASVGLAVHPGAKVYVLPGIGSFLGADTTGLVLASGFHQGQGPALALDIGTNGEIVGRSAGGQLVALSTAAGPAFEGGRISSGLRGVNGAIERVELRDEDLVVETIGHEPPIGICGSGLIDALAVMRRGGVLAPNGQLLREETGRPQSRKLARRVVNGPDVLEFLLTAAGEGRRKVSITQKDIRELQLAKGAIAAGIKIVLREIGAQEQELEEILLAGAFGTFIDKTSAQAIGLLPQVPLERVRSIGNAAGRGAKLALLSRAARVEAERLVRQIKVLNLATEAEFERVFLESMYFG